MAQVWFSGVETQDRYGTTPRLSFKYTDGRGGREIGSFAEWAHGGGGMTAYWADGNPKNWCYQKAGSRWEAEEWLKDIHLRADPEANPREYIPMPLELMDEIDRDGR